MRLSESSRVVRDFGFGVIAEHAARVEGARYGGERPDLERLSSPR